ncbi:hypothetical protein R6Q59_019903 [Mikania micrantha]
MGSILLPVSEVRAINCLRGVISVIFSFIFKEFYVFLLFFLLLDLSYFLLVATTVPNKDIWKIKTIVGTSACIHLASVAEAGGLVSDVFPSALCCLVDHKKKNHLKGSFF